MIKKREDTADYVCLPYYIYKVGDYKNALNVGSKYIEENDEAI